MKIETVNDKRLAALIKAGGASAKGLDPKAVRKLWRQLQALEAAETIQQVQTMPGWNLHPLPPHENKWAMWVTGNWRLTFYLRDGAIHDLDLEDYH